MTRLFTSKNINRKQTAKIQIRNVTKRGSMNRNSSGSEDSQSAHLKRCSTVERFAYSMKHLIADNYRIYKNGITPFDEFICQLLNRAVKGDYPHYSIDYSKVLVCRGLLYNNGIVTLAARKGELIFSWNTNCWSLAHKTDRSILVAYCEKTNETVFTTHGDCRKSGMGVLSVPAFRGMQVHAWLAFVTEDGKDVSNSVYVGMVRVT